MIRTLLRVCVALLALMIAPAALAEDGYDLWLRYPPVAEGEAAPYRAVARGIVADQSTPTMRVAVGELRRGLGGMLGAAPEMIGTAEEGAILLGTPAMSGEIAALRLPLTGLGKEGYCIRATQIGGKRVIAIAANDKVGVLYGVFHLLRLIQTRQSLDAIDIREAPKVQLRLLNHWDNLDRTVERGYAGASLWDWWKLPDVRDQRYIDYARANASLGINGAVVNNVNASAESLSPRYIAKAAALADVFRPYGIRLYLSARFSAPIELGGMKTADPIDPAVAAWWKAKADEIYAAIPDFGGFLVKANSEGQPGPQDYKRSHADGANMLARAIGDRGVVMWRAFVYAAENPADRVRQAYDEFKPLDGTFDDNVIVQVKNGPLDFQPREPFHPLFGAMPKTPLMIEFQITKEYLGFSTHLAYLGTLWEEVLRADTRVKGRGSTVAKVIDGRLEGHARTGIAGVANIGTDRTWSGSHFDQANWYAFGRMAWDPELSARSIAEDWAAMTFSPDPTIGAPVVGMMMRSREAVVDYMTPLGLAHLMATGHHYGPGPWVNDLARPDWNPTYYHRADRGGIGFDRTRTGSDAIAQYAPPVARLLADPRRIDERSLLWFHHVGWDRRMRSGRTLWDELVWRYGHGVDEVRAMAGTWDSLAGRIDPVRHSDIGTYLRIQQAEAQWWRDASVAYFSDVSGRPLPAGAAPPPHPLAWYRAQRFPFAPGN